MYNHLVVVGSVGKEGMKEVDFMSIDKQRIFLDFDGTLVNSRKAYFSAYEKLYSCHREYVHPNWDDGSNWNLRSMCPLAKEDLFEHDLFYYDLELEKDAYKYAEMISKKYDIIICSIGTYVNISKKAVWIKNRLPFIDKVILINNAHNHMDKSIIDMKGGIIIDDVSNNLITSNADMKLCYGDTYAWNDNWTGERCRTWEDVYNSLM